MAKGDRVLIPAAQIEFIEGGDTIWVHGPQGATVLRIKLNEPIEADRCSARISHMDIFAGETGTAAVCLGEDVEVDG